MSGSGADRPTPVRPYPDRDSVRYWEAVGEHRFELQRCSACGAWRWPPRELCNRCASFDYEWVAPAGTATVESWVVNHHGFSAQFGSPYTVVLGRLDEQADVCIPAQWRGDTPPSRGQALRLDFEDHADAEGQFTVVVWRPA